ncbi:hypothetical protein B0H14DRAFT_2597878 [Mycena olivaceomarginata]|nr:hypothetical protein B0H14DRAFT_2597878 [Mycena olivaceomarginata]
MPVGPPPYDNSALLCIPIYAPDAGHKDREASTGGFFRCDPRQLEGSGACTFTAFTWSSFLDLWTLDCSEYHEHECGAPEVCTRASLQVRQHLRSVAHYEHLVAADREIRVEEEAKRIKREEMEYLATTRPPPVPLSLQRTCDRMLGLGAGSPLPSVVRMRAEHASPSDARPSLTVTAPQVFLITPPQTSAHIAASNDAPMPTTRLSGLPAYTGVQKFETRQAPALYAIHMNGHNRIFTNQ